MSLQTSLSWGKFHHVVQKRKKLIYLDCMKVNRNIYIYIAKLCTAKYAERESKQKKNCLGFLQHKSNDNMQCYLPPLVWGGALACSPFGEKFR